MKILILNPHMQAQREWGKQLQSRGIGTLLASRPEEAWKLLRFHGKTVELAIVHREAGGAEAGGAEAGRNEAGTPGIDFLEQLKRDPEQDDLPLLLTTEALSDGECAVHQESAAGANAYLAYPSTIEKLNAMIEAILGQALPPSVAEPVALGLASVPELSSSDPLASEMTHVGLAAPSFPGLPQFNRPSFLEPGDERPAMPPSPSAFPEDATSVQTFSPPVSGDFSSQDLDISSLLPSVSVPSANANANPLTGEVNNPLELEEDPIIAAEMPYLLPTGAPTSAAAIAVAPASPTASTWASASLPLRMSIATGDALVPGGAAHSPDSETLKKYLLLREQDVAALSQQLRNTQDQLTAVDDLLRLERVRGQELAHVAEAQKHKIEGYERANDLTVDSLNQEVTDLKFQLKTRSDRIRNLETQIREAADEMERLKDRVRSDIRKIRVREKELENRLEIMKKDSEALIAARENKIVELKRKLDVVEFNTDLLQDQYAKEKEISGKLKERLDKALQAVRVAGGLLDDTPGTPSRGPSNLSAVAAQRQHSDDPDDRAAS